MRCRLKPQRGASLGIVLIVVVLVVFFGNLAVTMLPEYMNFMQVKSSMAAVHAKQDVIAGGPRKIAGAISSQLYINNVRSVPADSFAFEKSKQGWVATVNYDVQKPIFGNVEVVMHFAHSETYQTP
jgi:hypothetical protein